MSDIEAYAAEQNLTLVTPFESIGGDLVCVNGLYSKTYSIRIASGLREGYKGKLHHISDVYKILQKMQKEEPFCASVTQTSFVYPNVLKGSEPGVIIELINYPRFPKSQTWLDLKAKFIAYEVMKKLRQQRVSIITPTVTITLENPKLKDAS